MMMEASSQTPPCLAMYMTLTQSAVIGGLGAASVPTGNLNTHARRAMGVFLSSGTGPFPAFVRALKAAFRALNIVTGRRTSSASSTPSGTAIG